MSRANVALEPREIRHILGATAFALSQGINAVGPGEMTASDIGLAIRRMATFHKALLVAAQSPGAANAATPQSEARN